MGRFSTVKMVVGVTMAVVLAFLPSALSFFVNDSSPFARPLLLGILLVCTGGLIVLAVAGVRVFIQVENSVVERMEIVGKLMEQTENHTISRVEAARKLMEQTEERIVQMVEHLPTSVRIFPNTHAAFEEAQRVIYGELVAAVRGAQSRVRVVSLYKSRTLGCGEARSDYYGRLHGILEDKLRRGNFRFERIVQVEQVNDGEEDCLVDRSVDPLTCNHCRKLLSYKEDAGSVSLVQVPKSAGITPIGFMIIDSSIVVFLVPKITHSRTGSHIMTAIKVNDATGVLVQNMETFFAELKNAGEEVQRCACQSSNQT